jgi:transcriptional regulator with XRE-family HTH domain
MPSTNDVLLARVALGRRLAELRRQAGLSQRGLAPETGFSRSVLARAERGHRHVSQDFWLIVDTALGAQGELVAGHDQILALENSLREEARRLELAERERRARRLGKGRAHPVPAGQIIPGAVATVTPAAGVPGATLCPYCHRPVAITIQFATQKAETNDSPPTPLRIEGVKGR